MPPFTFTFPATSPSGKPTPTAAQLERYERVLRETIGASTVTLKLADNGDRTGTFTVTGTTDDLGTLEEKAGQAVEDLPSMAGWVASGVPKFAPDDPKPHDEDPDGGRRSATKRVRKVTRRHRKRKGSRKLRLKFF
jgi:hypothetical protein